MAAGNSSIRSLLRRLGRGLAPLATPAALAAGLLAAAPLHAQTGHELLLKPFALTDQLELNAEIFRTANHATDNFRDDGERFPFQLDLFELSGRFRLTHGLDEEGIARAQPRAGFRSLYIHLDTEDPALPGGLMDHSFGLGMGILAYQEWIGGISLGFGYAAATGPWDANATYLQASFAAGRVFDNKYDSLGFVLDYDQNRTILPDWPILGFQYRRRFDAPPRRLGDLLPESVTTPTTPTNATNGPGNGDDPATAPQPTDPNGAGVDAYDPAADPVRLGIAVGFPLSSVEWRPFERLLLQGDYMFPQTIEFRGELTVTQGIALYGALGNRIAPFWWDDLPGSSERIFYTQRMTEGGLLWDVDDRLKLVMALGYTFGQNFRTGRDTRDLTTAADLADTLYFRMLLELRL